MSIINRYSGLNGNLNNSPMEELWWKNSNAIIATTFMMKQKAPSTKGSRRGQRLSRYRTTFHARFVSSVINPILLK
jgi:hypothetical protein